eukprot:CAMPEP_0172502932 /NCGR_PEP_ID=MMETSP1066-20121228/164302_1 /TAXON_ID=671091 /ORGANISM="Coscinodiscus wailesii, Strain CCMP2513" /LENGTH=59 /DNA_ID=CAMNT_0013278413 /DNA_START=107 /DNA_END=283 /DNA_ORIENTATION=-
MWMISAGLVEGDWRVLIRASWFGEGDWYVKVPGGIIGNVGGVIVLVGGVSSLGLASNGF